MIMPSLYELALSRFLDFLSVHLVYINVIMVFLAFILTFRNK